MTERRDEIFGESRQLFQMNISNKQEPESDGEKGEKGDSNYLCWETGDSHPQQKCKKKKNEEFFRRMNGTERAGVLKNEKLEMDISLFPFPDISFY